MTTYGSTEGANALVQSWDGGASPEFLQVEVWLAEAYAKINRAIANAGYVAPITDTAVMLYPELTGLENLYAAAYILRSQGVDTASGDTEARSEVWLKDFYSQLEDLARSNLSLLGVTLLPSTTPSRRRRIGTLQMRRVDGYSNKRGTAWDDPYPSQGDYTVSTAPTE